MRGCQLEAGALKAKEGWGGGLSFGFESFKRVWTLDFKKISSPELIPHQNSDHQKRRSWSSGIALW